MPVFIWESTDLETRYGDVVQIVTGFYDEVQGTLIANENKLDTQISTVQIEGGATVRVLFEQLVFIRRREGYIQSIFTANS